MKLKPKNIPASPINVIIIVCFSCLLSTTTIAQNYTSISNGSWTAGSTWNNTSGWGGAFPAVGGSSGTININHDVSTPGNYSTASATVNVNAGSTLTINGNLTVGGGGTINVRGILIITGTAALSSNLNIFPGGQVIVQESITVNSSNYLNIGTNVNGPPYADLVVYGNLNSSGSGDITVNRNGRVAVFGNITSNSGGTVLTINNGGQVYVHGDLNFSGGTGNHIYNNNTTSPYGLYVNGSTSAQTGSGSTITTNQGDQDTMQNTNPNFFNWVSNIPLGPLPVTWLTFTTRNIDNKSVYLSWSTASEQDAESFFIERSSNGKDYLTIGSLPASGTSRVRQDYSFTDPNPNVGRTYYRLRQVDFDGTFAYSEVRAVTLNGRRSVSVFPNPLEKDELNVQLNFSDEDEVFVSVYDVSGLKIDQFSFFGAAFRKPLKLNAGTYLLKANAGRENLVFKFVVK
jgi:hypothetical protein